MEIQSRPPVERPKSSRQVPRVEERRTEAALADRRVQEQNVAEQRRQAELASTRRAQETAAEKGRQIDRYA